MKKIYFAGKFNLLKDDSLTLQDKLIDDYRSYILGSPQKLAYYNDEIYIKDKIHYLGPFYCEKASNGDFTSTDCKTVLNNERKFVIECDIFFVVFDYSFSVGSIVELGWALNMNKRIIILYREEPTKYSIKSEYWFAIADAMEKSNKLSVYKYSDENELKCKIDNILEELCQV